MNVSNASAMTDARRTSSAAAVADAIRGAWDRAGIRAAVFEATTSVLGYTVRAQQGCEPSPLARRD